DTIRHVTLWERLRQTIPSWAGNLALLLMLGGALLLGGLWLKSRSDSSPPSGLSTQPRAVAQTPEEIASVTAEPTPVATPEPTPTIDFNPLPDPPGGMLTFEPEQPGD